MTIAITVEPRYHELGEDASLENSKSKFSPFDLLYPG